MNHIKYLKIQNFKIFGAEETVIDFEDTTVLVGPNNAGKTTVIQAFTLWRLGVQAFFDAKTVVDSQTKQRKQKGKLDEKTGIGINRKDIEQVPITDTRQLFYKSRIRTGSTNEQIKITLGLQYKNEIKECIVTFKYFKSEVIYVYLNKLLCADIDLLIYASNLQINLLYPMSGLEREETVLQEGAIRKLIGRGITAGLLRNICYNLYVNDEKSWVELTKLMEKLFYITLESPRRLANDDLIVEYNYCEKSLKTDKPLDLLQAGRGQLQMLLILAFVMWRKQSVVLIDEPDAHLEVLRQSQIMEVLKSLTMQYGCQVIIATHSEVIMNEAQTLNLLLNGSKIELNESKQKAIKSSLKEFGIEQYYKATITKSVLYLEGTTDKQNLKALAQHLKHPLADVLSDKVFVYYTQSPTTEHHEFEMAIGYYQTHKKHFAALKPLVENFKGIAIFDNDNQNREYENMDNGLKIRFWKQYELENYFITPESVSYFVHDYFMKLEGGLFYEISVKNFEAIFEQCFLLPIFDHRQVLVNLYKNSKQEEKTALYASNSQNKKVSALLENTLKQFSLEHYKSIVLSKGNFYQLVPHCKSIDEEVIKILDEIYQVIYVQN
jgi:predicted ATPase